MGKNEREAGFCSEKRWKLERWGECEEMRKMKRMKRRKKRLVTIEEK